MTSIGAFPRALAAARPPKPPPTITTRGVFGVRSCASSIELRLASVIYPFLKLLGGRNFRESSFFSRSLNVTNAEPSSGPRPILGYLGWRLGDSQISADPRPYHARQR